MSRRSKRTVPPPIISRPPPDFELREEEVRAILSVADLLVGEAGRTTLVMALRGSQAEKVRRHQAQEASGFGFYQGRPEEEVLLRVDALIARGILRIKFVDGYPLLGYTEAGLALAQRFVAEQWLAAVRAQVEPVAQGARLGLPFLQSVLPQRNLDTLRLVVEAVAAEADARWLPLLEQWQAVETKRVRGWLEPILARLRLPGSPA